MSWTFVQRTATTWFLNGTSPSLTVTSTTAGNLLVMAVSCPNVNSNTFGFPAGWSTPVHISGTSNEIWVAWYLNNPGSITSVQVTGVTNTTDTFAVMFEFSTNNGNSNEAKDNHATNSGSSVGPFTATETLAATGELVFGFAAFLNYNDTGTPTYDSGFTGHVQHAASAGSGYDEYNASFTGTSGSISITPSGSPSSANWTSMIIAFTDAGAASTFPAGFGFPNRSVYIQLLGGG